MMIIDKLAYSSGLRCKSPYLKAALAVGTLCICVAARSFVVSFIVLAAMGCLTVFTSRTSLSHYIKLMAAPLVFLAIGTIAIAINFTDAPMDLFSVAVGGHYLAVSYHSALYALQLIVISLASVSCLYFLTLTTPMLDLIAVLRSLGCPWIIVELMMMIYRYIFVLLDMASAIMTAQNCRLGNRTAKSAVRGMGLMLSVVLMRALNRASLLYDAMESRCYDGEIRVISQSYKSTGKERGLVGLFLIGLLALALLCRWKGGIV